MLYYYLVQRYNVQVFFEIVLLVVNHMKIERIDKAILKDIALINFILVVQNNNLEMITFSKVTVRETLYIFIHAANYIQALQIVQVFKPDCLLVEENFSVTSGLELAHSLQAQSRMKEVPVVVFGPYHTLASQEQKISSANKLPPTIPQMEILLALIDQILLFPGQLLVHSFSIS